MKKDELQADLEGLVKKWKDKRGNLIMILHSIENIYGYVPRDTSLKLSKLLDVPLARIYEVITFYNYFRLEPPAEHNVAVCMGTACYLKGASELIDEVDRILHITEGQTTKDGMFHLDVVRCLGCCGLAPVMMIDQKVYGKVKKSEIADILSKYIKEEA